MCVLILCVAGCGSKGNDGGKEVGDTSNTSDTINTASQSESSKGEEITTEEETTDETLEWTESLKRDPSLCTLIDKINIVNEVFQSKTIKNGDVIDCWKETEELGYDKDEYGCVFAYIYSTLYAISDKLIRNPIDFYTDTDYYFPIVNSEHNYIIENQAERTFNLQVTADDNANVTFKVIFE